MRRLLAALLIALPVSADNGYIQNRTLPQFYGPSSCGTSGQVITSNADCSVSWSTPSTTSPGGSSGQVQYNTGSAFGGITNATTDGTTLTVSSMVVSNANPNYLLYANSSRALVEDNNGFLWDSTNKCYDMGHIQACEGFIDYRTNNPAVNQIRIANSNSAGQSRILFYNDAGTSVYFGQAGSGLGNFFQNQTLMQADGNAAFIVTGGTHSWTSADLAIITAGKTLRIAGGSNAKFEQGTLSSGVKFMPNTSITSKSQVNCNVTTISGTSTGVYISSITAGNGYNVAGAVTDNSSFNCSIIEGW